jgi:Mn2+/Fe2+ NRAMP family transporter
MPAPPKPPPGLLSGAAFLMAVSAIGPGFLTQTTQFTAQFGASLACAILLSTVIDIGAQVNTWRVLGVSGRRGSQVADAVLPGLGWVLSGVIVLGSFLFNVGNLGGCGLGLEALVGLPQSWGVVLSGAMAVGLFLLPQMLRGMDWFAKVLGAGMILVTLYVVAVTRPPVSEAAYRAVWPVDLDVASLVTLVGGTIGGYIMFSGAHRLLDGGVTGPEQVGSLTRAAVQGIVITGVMRMVLFLAILGVVSAGATIGPDRPVFDAFRAGAGQVGYALSGLVFWAAAITSVVGCSYTSVTFLERKAGGRRRQVLIVGFTALGVLVTLAARWLDWQATPLLILAGRVNGILLPVILGVILLAAHRRSLMGDYRHPLWATAFGLVAWLTTVFLAGWTLWVMIR